MPEDWMVYEEGMPMYASLEGGVTFSETWEEKEEEIKLPCLHKRLKIKPFKVWKIWVFVEPKDLEYETYSKAKPNKITFLSVIKAEIITKEGRHFSRKLQIRIDDTKHDGTYIHINLDFTDKDLDSGRSVAYPLKKLHFTSLEPNKPRFFFINMWSVCSNASLRFGFFPREDMEHHKKQREFFNKIKKRELTIEDEKAYQIEFDAYVESLKKRGLFKGTA